MKYVLFFNLFLLSNLCFSQDFKQYDWDHDRQPFELDNDDHTEVIILNNIDYQFIYEGDDLVLYYTKHFIVKANSDKAVSSNNRIYIPLNNNLELIALKARTLSGNGKSTELDKNEIKEVKDENSGNGYKIFAVEGAKVGDEIEYFYTRKMTPENSGREFAQYNSPTREFSFSLSCPSNLQYGMKAYNGLPDIETKHTDGFNKYYVKASNIPGLSSEPFSNYNSERMRVEFILEFNSYGDGSKIYTWEKIGKNIYSFFNNIEKSEEKALKKLAKDIDISESLESITKAKIIEDYIKENFFYEENAGSESNNLEFIIKNKYSNKIGLTKLTIALLKKFNITHEIILSPDRLDVEIDLDFESYNYLEDYLIYLPENGRYISPYDMTIRLDIPPAKNSATDAIFIKEVKIRENIFPLIEARYIKAPKADENNDNMDIDISFVNDLSANKIHLNREFSGYQSSYIKSILPFIEEEQKDELLKNLVKFISSDADIESMKFEQTEFNYSNWAKPLVISSTFESKAFLETAGSVLLLKVGELIGPQSELYQENDRKTDVMNEFNRKYDRTITLHLPENYEVQNLEELEIDKAVRNQDKEIYKFQSSYEIVEDKLVINIDEFYDQIYYPKEDFKSFQNVINAAADFNKIVLVLKKI